MKAILIDDEPAMHLIIKRMLRNVGEVEVVGSFQDTRSAFSFLEKQPVDLAFVDIHMSKENGLDFAKRLRDRGWPLKLVFVTSHKEFALSAFDVYAYDYIVKPISQGRLMQTVERVLAEKLSSHRNEEEISTPTLIEPLTKREKEVLQLMSNGLSNKEIAVTIKLSEGTIKNHLVNIFGKLQVKNRVQATITGKKLKIIH